MTNTKQNLNCNLSTVLRETSIGNVDSKSKGYKEEPTNNGTDESPNAETDDKIPLDGTCEEKGKDTEHKVSELQPSPVPSEDSDIREWEEWINWPEEEPDEELSPLTGTTSLPATPESSKEMPRSGSQAQEEPPDTLGFGKVGLGFMETPEVRNVPSIRGELNGTPCKILLDSGCGTYAISRAFADEKGIAMIPTPPIPLELAEETDEEREIRSQTKPIRIRLGNNVDVWKTFYVLDKGCHDIIFGSPFFRSFTPQFDWGNHEVKIARETHQLLSPTKISAANILSKLQSHIPSQTQGTGSSW
jgi:Aspartyl protease